MFNFASIELLSTGTKAHRSSALFPHRIYNLLNEVSKLCGVVDECSTLNVQTFDPLKKYSSRFKATCMALDCNVSLS